MPGKPAVRLIRKNYGSVQPVSSASERMQSLKRGERMRHSNLHTHTVFSDGKHTPEENVRSAIAKNMVSVGFSDHCYTDFDQRYCIPKSEVPAYVDEIRRLKKAYEDRIEIFVGLEWDGNAPLENREEYDYLIGDSHYVVANGKYCSVDHAADEQKEALERYFGGDGVVYAREYFRRYTECMLRCRPDILGHFDLPVKFGFVDETAEAYRKYALDALVDCLEVTRLVEVNTGAVARGLRKDPYPADFLLKEILVRKGGVVLSSDSHDAANLDYDFDRTTDLLRAVGFRSIVQLRRNGFVEVGI